MAGTELTEKTEYAERVGKAVNYFLKPRRKDGHKGDFGKTFIIAGSRGMSGAAVLCARACMHAGCGLTYMVVPGALETAASAAVPEAVKCPAGDDGTRFFGPEHIEFVKETCREADAVVLGPGLGRRPETGEFVRALLADAEFAKRAGGIIIDADGLYAVSGNIQRLRELAGKHPGRFVLTPHEGEAARLILKDAKEIRADRKGSAEFIAAALNGGTALLKGADTLVAASGREIFVNPTGGPGMATGGSGDVLAGILGAFISQELAGGYMAEEQDGGRSAVGLFENVAFGATIHGLSGDIMASRYGERYITASDIIDGLGEIKRYAEQHPCMG